GAEPRKDVAEQRAPGALGGLRLRESGQDLLLGLDAETAEVAQPVGFGRLAQLVDGRDPELLPDPSRRLRPDPRHAHDPCALYRPPTLPLRERVDPAFVHALDDLPLDRPPDPLQLLRAPVEREPRHRAPGLEDPSSGPAVGGDAEPVGALELH